TRAGTKAVVGAMKANGKPAYLQEPMTTRDALFRYPSNDKSEYFLQGYANAKLSGAAAWCFHTEVAVDFGDGGPPFLEDRLRAYPEPEWNFVTAMKPRVVLRTNNSANYVVAEGGGGAIHHGDAVSFRAGDSSWYIVAEGGGGGNVAANSATRGGWETFVLLFVTPHFP